MTMKDMCAKSRDPCTASALLVRLEYSKEVWRWSDKVVACTVLRKRTSLLPVSGRRTGLLSHVAVAGCPRGMSCSTIADSVRTERTSAMLNKQMQRQSVSQRAAGTQR